MAYQSLPVPVPITGNQTALQSGSWTSATALNTAVTLAVTNINTVTVGISTTSTFTAGIVTFEVSPDGGTTYFPVAMAPIDRFGADLTYSFVASTQRAWATSVDAFTHFRVRLSTVITGTGTASVFVIGQLFAVEPIVSVGAGETLVKGTQLPRGFSIQSLNDSGRTAVVLWATAAASGTTGTETAITLTKAEGTGATSNATSFVVTSGKILRITGIIFSAVGHATGTTQSTIFKLRMNTAGAVTTTSTPILFQVRVQTPATSLAYQQVAIPVPEGYEITGNGTIQIGVTAAATFVTNAPTWDVMIVGYYY